jgi:hypothetical protein
MQLDKHVKQGKLLYLNQSEHLSVSENAHYRWLSFGDVVQSVMLKRTVSKLTLPHQKIMMLPLLFFTPQNVVEIGLGGGNTGRFLTHLIPDLSFRSIELSASVIECFDKFFNPQKSTITVQHDNATLWLQSDFDNEKDTIDWLISDVYQEDAEDFNTTLDLLNSIVVDFPCNNCLTLNLPGFTDHEVNLCLTVIQQLESTHHIAYFHVPNHLNVIVHILPAHWQIDKQLQKQKHRVLKKYTYTRWKKFWKHYQLNV